MYGSLCGGTWLYQRIVDDQPALPLAGTRIQFQGRFDFLNGKMRSGSGDAGHAALLEILHSLSLYIELRTSPLDRGLGQALHLLVSIVERALERLLLSPGSTDYERSLFLGAV
jgi:hypothetical protein